MDFAAGEQDIHQWNIEVVIRLAKLRTYPVRLQVRFERGRDQDAAVFLLVSFNQSHEKPGERRPAAIQEMRKLILTGFGFEP
jgi:hypothetical protein